MLNPFKSNLLFHGTSFHHPQPQKKRHVQLSSRVSQHQTLASHRVMVWADFPFKWHQPWAKHQADWESFQFTIAG